MKFCTQIGLVYLSYTKVHALQSPGIQTETGWMYRWVGGLMGTWGGGFVHRWMDGLVGGCVHGWWMDRLLGGYMSGYMDGWISSVLTLHNRMVWVFATKETDGREASRHHCSQASCHCHGNQTPSCKLDEICFSCHGYSWSQIRRQSKKELKFKMAAIQVFQRPYNFIC